MVAFAHGNHLGHWHILKNDRVVFEDKRFARRLRRTRITAAADCWIWWGSKDEKGWATMSFRAHREPAAFVIWRHIHGELEPGMKLWRKCIRRICVYPGHVEAIPEDEHRRRSAIVIQAGRQPGLFDGPWEPLNDPGVYARFKSDVPNHNIVDRHWLSDEKRMPLWRVRGGPEEHEEGGSEILDNVDTV